MKSIIAIRSYGDYVVLLYNLKLIKQPGFYKIYVSKHLEQLHNALDLEKMEGIFFYFIDFSIQKGLLTFFTNRYLLSISTIKSLRQISDYFKNVDKSNIEIYIEQNKRIIFFNFFTSLQTKAIHNSKKNIYLSYQSFFGIKIDESANLPKSKTKKIILFPDSRKKEKELSEKLVQEISNGIKYNIIVAKFGKSKNNNAGKQVYYNNFKALVELIKESDLIISSDSLPAHIAQYYQKSNWVIFNKEINHEWLTPFGIDNETYCLSEDIIPLVKYVNSIC